MNRQPPGTLRVLRLLAGIALRRIGRSLQIARSKRNPGGGRRGRPPKKGSAAMLLLMVVALPMFGIQASLGSASALQGLTVSLAETGPDGGGRPVQSRAHSLRERRGARESRRPHYVFAPSDWPKPANEARFLVGVALLTTIIIVLLLAAALGLANEDLGRAEWRFVALFAYPVATRSLVLARILEHTLVQFLAWFLLFPIFAQTAHGAGSGGWSIPFAAVGTLSCTALVASLRVWLETVLRMSLPIRHVRTAQALFSLLALSLFGVLLLINRSLGRGVPDWFLGLVDATGTWILLLPYAWPISALRSGALPIAFGLSGVFAVSWWCRRAIERRLQAGIVTTTGTSPGTRGTTNWARPRWLRGVLGKEVLLVLRDRNFLVQTLVAPAFLIGMQVIAQPGMSRVMDAESTTLAVLLAYGVGAYALSPGCFQILAAEGRALWLLQAAPIELATALASKIRLWAGVGTAFAIITLAVLTPVHDAISHPAQTLSDLFFVIAGIWCAAHVAAGIGALATDVRDGHPARRVQLRFGYLYLFLAGFYVAGLQSPDLAPRCAALLAFGTLSFALWDQVRERLPHLLDSERSRTRAISPFDAMVAVTTFLALQVIVALVLGVGSFASAGSPDLLGPLIAFVVSGAITVALFGAVLAARGVPLVDALHLRHAPRGRFGALALGLLVGLALGAAGLGYVELNRSFGWFEMPASRLGRWDSYLLLILAVGAAPLFEEIVFRGMLFAGLARTVRPLTAALWSAAVFAVGHPVVSWAPVFVLGVGAALVFRATRFLPAAMVTHAVYNLIVSVSFTLS